MIANTIMKRLALGDCRPGMLSKFNRYQDVKRCWRKENGAWALKDIAFIEQWDNKSKSEVISSFISCIEGGGSIIAIYMDDNLIAFSQIESKLFGSKSEYVNLASMQVSYEFRRQGLGKSLFEESCMEAKRMGAKKLYISAHSSEETQAYYRAMGCREATEINPELFEKEPFDVHMEYCLN
jgi:ribosomal protein S18 acetylase RimI-like enzyme